MPFIKRGSADATTSLEPGADRTSLIASLRSPDAESRWRAVRALAASADVVSLLADALARETVPRVREAIMTALMRIGDEASVQALLPYLRSEDAGQRAAAIEALQG